MYFYIACLHWPKKAPSSSLSNKFNYDIQVPTDFILFFSPIVCINPSEASY